MSLEPETVTIERRVPTSDSAGGSRSSWSFVYSGPAYINFTRRYRDERIEEGTHNSQGPGWAQMQRPFACFEQDDPQALRNDRLTRADGSQYLILFVRNYTDSAQIDIQCMMERIL